MKVHKFEQNNFVVFDSLEQRLEYCKIAKANGYPLDKDCFKGGKDCLEIRFRNAYGGFTLWVIGSTNCPVPEVKIKPYDFLKLVSQYEVGDEVEVLKDNNCGCSAKAGDIVKVVNVDSIENGGQVTLDLSNSPFSTLHNLKLHKSISNKQSKTTDMDKEIKVGDLLEVIKSESRHCFMVGEKIIVSEIVSGSPPYRCKRADGSSVPHNCHVRANEVKIINNQKTTSMKKFKNRFAVTGSLSLIKAFAEELEAIGYKNVNRCNERFIIVGTYDDTLAHNEYGIYSSKGAMTETLYDLPKDWDRALAAAKETVEEQKTYQFGGKTWYSRNNASLTETPTGGAGVNVRDLKEWYKWFNSMPKRLTSLDCSMPDGHVTLGCTTGTLHEALAICKDLFKD